MLVRKRLIKSVAFNLVSSVQRGREVYNRTELKANAFKRELTLLVSCLHHKTSIFFYPVYFSLSFL